MPLFTGALGYLQFVNAQESDQPAILDSILRSSPNAQSPVSMVAERFQERCFATRRDAPGYPMTAPQAQTETKSVEIGYPHLSDDIGIAFVELSIHSCH